jgi:Arc/MetJ-type ribon-helix-helix transcriptional regulator
MGTQKPQVATRIAPEDEKKILSLVQQGKFINTSDFLRAAIRGQLEKVEGKAS